jgi:hypothetical protein
MFPRDHFANKALSIMTAMCFLITMSGTDIAKAALVTPDLMQGIGSPGAYQAAINVADLEIPTRFGEVKNRVSGDNDTTIIHIQDAHCNYSAQKSIANMVGYLNKEYGTDLVFLEGGAGEYNLSVFTDIPDRAIREEVADYFVREGRVTGPEFFAINNPEDVELVGIEDPELYVGNLDTYRKALSFKEESDEGLAFLAHWMANFKRKIYSPEMLEMDAKRTGYKNKEI